MLMAGPGIGSADVAYASAAKSECTMPVEDTATCARSAWARPDGKFGGHLELASVSPAGGWTYGSGSITLTRRLEYTKGISTLEYAYHVLQARAVVDTAANRPQTVQANIVHTVTFEHDCGCVDPATVDYMGPLISTDGRFPNSMYADTPRYRTTAIADWPSGLVRVTLRFDLDAQLGDMRHFYVSDEPTIVPLLPASGRVLVFIKGYVTDMKFTRLQDGG